MTRDEIISELYRSGIIHRFCAALSHGSLGSSIDDFVGEVFAKLCEVDEGKLVEMHGRDGIKGVERYAFQVARSRYYDDHKHRRLRFIDDSLLLVDFDDKLNKYYDSISEDGFI